MGDSWTNGAASRCRFRAAAKRGERFAFLAALREGLLHDNVLAVLERQSRELGMRCGRREDDDDVDVRLHDLPRVGGELRSGTASEELGPRLRPASADRPLASEAARHEPVEHLEVGRQNVARADDADARRNGHRVSEPRSRYRAPWTSRTGVSTPSSSRTTPSSPSQPDTVHTARQRGSGPSPPMRSQSRLSSGSCAGRAAREKKDATSSRPTPGAKSRYSP